MPHTQILGNAGTWQLQRKKVVADEVQRYNQHPQEIDAFLVWLKYFLLVVKLVK